MFILGLFEGNLEVKALFLQVLLFRFFHLLGVAILNHNNSRGSRGNYGDL